MFKLLFLVALFAVTLSAPNFNERIIGGTNAKDGEFPYMVSIRKYKKHFCGGSILNSKFVLTAAHCVYDDRCNPLVFKIQYGTINSSSSVNLIDVSKITVHKDYKSSLGMPNDIAIIKLDKDIVLGPAVKPVVLPAATDIPAANSKTILTGWGLTTNNGSNAVILQKVQLDLFADDVCKSKEKLYDSRYHICSGIMAGGKGQCTADSGGPLMIGGKQFGIVSWSTKPCAGANHPGVFTKVTKYRAWIKEIAGV